MRARALQLVGTLGEPALRRRGALASAALALATTLGVSTGRAQGVDAPVPATGAAPAPAPAPNATGVVMPKIVHFEPAQYPAEAEKARLEANVLLKLTIDVEGNVTAADVAEPVGHGFDEAAHDAALKFKFEPARQNGQPIAVKILYRYEFKLQAKTVTDARTAPPAGALEGKLRIAGSDAPLAGAEVEIRGPTGAPRVVRSDERGVWQLEALPPGEYKLKVTVPGFRPLESAETVVAGEATEITYRLSPEAEEHADEGIEVVVTGERPPREVTRRTLERREIERVPGTGGDALRSIESLPGVARAPGFTGLLVVRGSAPEDTGIFVDGAVAPLIYHFGGLSSVIPTELLDRIDFYPGNFGAQYGQVMGGIVDVGLRNPDTQCLGPYGKATNKTGCYHGLAQVDLIDGRILLQGPVGPAKNWTFAIGARRSWIDTWLKPVLEASGAGVTTAPVYYDYQAILQNRPSSHSNLRLQVYGTDDRLEIVIKDPASQDPAFGGAVSFGTSFYRLQAIYEDHLSSSVDLTSMVSVGRSTLRFSLGTFLFDFKSYPITGRSELGFKLARWARLNAGLDYIAAPYDVTVRFPPAPRPGEPDPGPFATRPPLEQHNIGTAFRPGWYTEAELTPTPRWRVVPSLRADFARDSGHTDLSPRINARFDVIPADVAKGQRRTTIKGGVGVYRQPPQFQETDTVFGTPGLESNSAIHYSLGAEQELTRHVELSVEGFYKHLTHLVVPGPLPNGAFGYTNQGTGSVIGLETLLKYKPDDRFFGWISYSLERSVRRDHPGEPEYLFQYDQTHNLILLGSYRLGRGWEFGGRFRIVSGSLYTPVLGAPALPAVYAADAGSYTALSGQPFSRRLPLFHALDLRLDKRWQFEDWRLSTYLDIQNVYNYQAVEGVVYNYNYSQQAYQTGLPIIPSIGIRGEF